MSQIPTWANRLIKQVCKDYRRKLPVVQWYDCSNTRNHSSGRTWHWRGRAVSRSSGYVWRHWNKIHISAGADEQDQKLVLLHELAHHIMNKTRKGSKAHHSQKFWELAFELYDQYGIDLEYAYDRERHYRVKATTAYNKHLTKKTALAVA